MNVIDRYICLAVGLIATAFFALGFITAMVL